ncbi:MAG: ATP-binding cassette domain-containing protein [Thermomicrobiales bacterium]
MSTPILATKLYVPPPQPRVVLRPRLIARLNDGLHRKLTLISAPAGFGKTTSIRLILGLDSPTAGIVTVNGQSYRDKRAPMQEVGALIYPSAVHGGRSAYNHLLWQAQAGGPPRRRVDEVLEVAGLTDVTGKKVGGFSLGMHQRLGIASALLGDPPVLLFDEPMNGLDPEGIQWVRSLMRRFADEGRTIFLSSHMMSEMEQTADHVLVIGKGRLVADLPMAEFTNRSAHSHVKVVSLRAHELVPYLEANGAFVTNGTTNELAVTRLDASLVGAIAFEQGDSLERAFDAAGEPRGRFHGTDLRQRRVPGRSWSGPRSCRRIKHEPPTRGRKDSVR